MLVSFGGSGADPCFFFRLRPIAIFSFCSLLLDVPRGFPVYFMILFGISLPCAFLFSQFSSNKYRIHLLPQPRGQPGSQSGPSPGRAAAAAAASAASVCLLRSAHQSERPFSRPLIHRRDHDYWQLPTLPDIKVDPVFPGRRNRKYSPLLLALLLLLLLCLMSREK